MSGIVTTYCPRTGQRMTDESEPYVQPEVMPSIGANSGAMRTMDHIVGHTSSVLEQAAHYKMMAERYKALWLCEVMRGDHLYEETYKISELDRARETIEGWSTSVDEQGGITARFES